MNKVMKNFYRNIKQFSITGNNISILSSFNQYNFYNNKHSISLKCFSVTNQQTFSSLPNISLNTISDNPNANRKKLQKGRGPGTGLGKTAGRGKKGKQRSYSPPVHIQGGQSPLQRIMPKFGSSGKRIEERFSEFNFEKLHYLIVKGRIDCSKPIGIREICQAGGVSKLNAGIKLLGRGIEKIDELPPLDITVSSASEIVIKKIKEKGGKITCKYMSKLVLKQESKPYKMVQLVKESVPKYRQILYYMKLEERGANVIFLKPSWMINNQYKELKDKIVKIRKMLDDQPDAHLLPVYPADRSEGSGKNKTRVQNRLRGRVITFEKDKQKKKK